METAQHRDKVAKNQLAAITMFQISGVQEDPALNGPRSFLALRATDRRHFEFTDGRMGTDHSGCSDVFGRECRVATTQHFTGNGVPSRLSFPSPHVNVYAATIATTGVTAPLLFSSMKSTPFTLTPDRPGRGNSGEVGLPVADALGIRHKALAAFREFAKLTDAIVEGDDSPVIQLH